MLSVSNDSEDVRNAVILDFQCTKLHSLCLKWLLKPFIWSVIYKKKKHCDLSCTVKSVFEQNGVILFAQLYVQVHFILSFFLLKVTASNPVIMNSRSCSSIFWKIHEAKCTNWENVRFEVVESFGRLNCSYLHNAKRCTNCCSKRRRWASSWLGPSGPRHAL